MSMSLARRARASSSNATAFVLSQWTRDHENAAACIGLLENQYSEPHSRPLDQGLASSLINQFIDAPDDFHHILERKAYRRAWARSLQRLPSILDIDKRRSVLRDAREHLASALESSSANGQNTRRSAIAHYADCAKAAMKADEQTLFPLLRRYLTDNDWRELANDLRAYQKVVKELGNSMYAQRH